MIFPYMNYLCSLIEKNSRSYLLKKYKFSEDEYNRACYALTCADLVLSERSGMCSPGRQDLRFPFYWICSFFSFQSVNH